MTVKPFMSKLLMYKTLAEGSSTHICLSLSLTVTNCVLGFNVTLYLLCYYNLQLQLVEVVMVQGNPSYTLPFQGEAGNNTNGSNFSEHRQLALQRRSNTLL